jgi:hypothetical protein
MFLRELSVKEQRRILARDFIGEEPGKCLVGDSSVQI